jgi:hypothetical protein
MTTALKAFLREALDTGAKSDQVDWDGVVREVVAYMDKYHDGKPDWIRLKDVPDTRLDFLYQAGTRKIRWLEGKAKRQAAAAFKSMRKRLAKFGLKADPYSESLYTGPSGEYISLGIGGFTGSPVGGKELPVP